MGVVAGFESAPADLWPVILARIAAAGICVAERGEDWARERLSEDLGKELAPCRKMPGFEVPDHLGWHEQGDGKLYLGVPIASGRIVDDMPITAERPRTTDTLLEPQMVQDKHVLLAHLGLETRRPDRPAAAAS